MKKCCRNCKYCIQNPFYKSEIWCGRRGIQDNVLHQFFPVPISTKVLTRINKCELYEERGKDNGYQEN